MPNSMHQPIPRYVAKKLAAEVFNLRPAQLKARLSRWFDACVDARMDATTQMARLELAAALATEALFQIGIERIAPVTGETYALALMTHVFEQSGRRRRAYKTATVRARPASPRHARDG